MTYAKNLWMFIFCFMWASLAIPDSAAAGSYPPPPVPPPPPPGLAETYYSTCAGTHPPVQYIKTRLKKGDPGYTELEQYTRSPEYRKYQSELAGYKARYFDKNRGYGDVNPHTGQQRGTDSRYDRNVQRKRERRRRLAQRRQEESERRRRAREQASESSDKKHNSEKEDPIPIAINNKLEPQASRNQSRNRLGLPSSNRGVPSLITPGGPQRLFGFTTGNAAGGASAPLYNGKMMGSFSGRVNRNPRQDLATWFRNALYHEALVGALYENDPEPVRASGK